MQYPELADKILKYLIDDRIGHWQTPSEIAEGIDSTEHKVKDTIYEIRKKYPIWLKVHQNTKGDTLSITVPEKCVLNINDFRTNGGFSKYFFEEAQKEKEVNELQQKNLELTNEALVYESTLREQEEIIKDLTGKNLSLKNRVVKLSIVYAIISFIAGLAAANWEKILILIKSF